MSQRSTSPGASLIHLRRPAQLGSSNDKPNLQVLVHDEPVRDRDASACTSPTSVMFCPGRVNPSMKVDTATRPLERRPYPMARASSDGVVPPWSAACSSLEHVASSAGLRSKALALIAKPKSRWQRDEDTAFCSHPLCSTMFAHGTLMIGPRRHHCRMCGLIFCHTHSTGRLPLQTSQSADESDIRSLRVCDRCRERGTELAVQSDCHSSETAPSLVSSAGSSNEEDVTIPVSPQLFPARPINRSVSFTAINDLEPQLAPVEEWMDRSGVLSLYPLAVQPSHGRRPVSPCASRAAGPLFAPPLSERRNAHEKTIQRRCRQRRLWAITPSTSEVESDGGAEDDSGWSSRATPLEPSQDWSTF